MEHIEYAYTHGMNDEEIAERLHTEGTGVLSLADDGDAYGVPLAHYYDGEDIYFRLGMTEDSQKRDLLERGGTVSYAVYGTDETDDPRGIDSWSILAEGTLTRIPESDHERFDTAEINRHFSPIRVFDEDIEEIEIVIVRLDADSVTGRRTSFD
ncbi:pyridoxamine 5'-phosphate oxidase family protein [Haloarchaeobius salinus]|uniref:pyridoxamine 5'-phosphate oxidase family protein n=1 Tax=Haloarchaeobius salinus TaxID=1198298 RepID=UPI00210C24DB|nr:pyridoxamine 5'-phosphate oxidase family protein [Haloarchaeobius salinus]